MDKLNTKTKLKKLLYIFQLAEYDAPFFLNWIKQYSNWEDWMKKSEKDPIWTAKAKSIFILANFFSLFSFIFPDKIYYTLVLADKCIEPLEEIIIFIFVLRVKLRLKKFHNLIKIGIAGSYGKTTTKEYLAEVLSSRYRVFKSSENINTLVGLAKLILKGLDESHQILIVEAAAYKKGDIKKISKMIKPQIGILTGLSSQHLERFGSPENIIEAKFEIVKALDNDGQIFLNADSPLIMQNYQKFIKNQPEFYGLNPEISKIFEAGNIGVSDKGLKFDVFKNKKLYFNGNVAVFGRHQLAPVLLAISIADKLGMTKEEILTGIKNLKSLNRRLSIQRTPQGFTIIDDSYNISEDSFKAALGFLKEAFPDKRKIVITAGLVEQGDKKSEANILFGEKLKETADIILIPKNSNTPYLIKGLKLSKNEILEYNNNGKIIDNGGKKAVIFNDVDELHCNFRLIFKPNDAVLIFPYDLPAHYH